MRGSDGWRRGDESIGMQLILVLVENKRGIVERERHGSSKAWERKEMSHSYQPCINERLVDQRVLGDKFCCT